MDIVPECFVLRSSQNCHISLLGHLPRRLERNLAVAMSLMPTGRQQRTKNGSQLCAGDESKQGSLDLAVKEKSRESGSSAHRLRGCTRAPAHPFTKHLACQNFRDEVTPEARISLSYSDAKHLTPGGNPIGLFLRPLPAWLSPASGRALWCSVPRGR